MRGEFRCTVVEVDTGKVFSEFTMVPGMEHTLGVVEVKTPEDVFPMVTRTLGTEAADPDGLQEPGADADIRAKVEEHQKLLAGLGGFSVLGRLREFATDVNEIDDELKQLRETVSVISNTAGDGLIETAKALQELEAKMNALSKQHAKKTAAKR
jgi:hypothetical protein